MIRTLLVDDEQLARDRLRELLRPFPEIEVVGEADDAEEAMERMLEARPDLIFLDIQMPGCSGLEFAGSLPSPRPKIIFCTAFDEYAIEAFELHAVDYLLKPVSRVRLARSLERVRQLSGDESDRAIDEVTRTIRAKPLRFLVKRAGRFRVIMQNEVLYFGFEEGLTRLYSREQGYVIQPSLSDLEKRLDPNDFCRVSRTAIVNLNAVQEVLPMPGGHAEVLLRSGARLEVSRRRLKDLMSQLGQGY